MGEFMSKKIDGVCFKNMVDYAVRNLNNHVRLVNRLNVFPVPDGDTGTNMVTTIHNGLKAVGESIVDLPSVSRKFARSIVFEARGNSGVIVSQFLKGISERFYDVDAADSAMFIEALEKGVQYAYSSVATPVEGTMLTVMKDATVAVKRDFTGEESIGQIVDSFVDHAKISLENTPELLTVLKESGVVDSGGAGVVYLFEGMKKYLHGESIGAPVEDKQAAAAIDYDVFHRDSVFTFGYCTELLVQLLNGREDFAPTAFREQIAQLGDSLVVSAENDKVRIHIHTSCPEQVFALCHRYGEFLSVKVENMTVQHTEQSKRILCAETRSDGAFSIVAVAFDVHTQELFGEMGADVVIRAEENASTKDYLDGFEKCGADRIIVFPNSSDGILSAMQAKKLYKKAEVTVINSRSVAECYAALPTVDFEETDVAQVTDALTQVINNLLIVSVAKRDHAFRYRDTEIRENEYYSFTGKELIAIGRSPEETVLRTVEKILGEQEREILTVFYRPETEETVSSVLDAVAEHDLSPEVFRVETESLPCFMLLSFE